MRFVSEDGKIFSLREGSLILGRHPSCNLTVQATGVSKKHIQCYIEGAAVTIRDLGSSNGTFVNGMRVSSCVLKDGDIISLGGYKLRLDLEGVEPSPAGETIRMAAPPPEPETPQGELTPIDFEKEPSSDDTPADGSFVPQSFQEAQQAIQPQVIARDGKMYLRDPRTNSACRTN